MKWLIALLLLSACTVTGNVVKEYSLDTEVYFCPRDNCRQMFFNEIYAANDVNCAIYDLDLAEIITLLKVKNAKLVFDHETSNRTELIKIGAVLDSKNTQMHNKFCILDNKTVITGSMNPTLRDTGLNNNNLLILHSESIAKTYMEEFYELHNATFSGGKRTKQSEFYLNNEKILIYFCPEDWCVNKILDAMAPAAKSIYFMTFSFTHDKIGDMLIDKHNQGLIVKGVMEKTQNNAFSEYERLNKSGVDVMWDKNKGNMHHKVFVVDESIVITGSINPSINGDTKNDENLLIIESPRLAKMYIEEYGIISK